MSVMLDLVNALATACVTKLEWSVNHVISNSIQYFPMWSKCSQVLRLHSTTIPVNSFTRDLHLAPRSAIQGYWPKSAFWPFVILMPDVLPHNSLGNNGLFICSLWCSTGQQNFFSSWLHLNNIELSLFRFFKLSEQSFSVIHVVPSSHAESCSSPSPVNQPNYKF